MACKLFSTSVSDFPLAHGKLSNFPQIIPPNVSPGHGYCSFKFLSSSRRVFSSSLVVHAAKGEAIQSPNSVSTLDSKTTLPSSSKLVLVVGGTGGVGKRSLLPSYVPPHKILYFYRRTCEFSHLLKESILLSICSECDSGNACDIC